MFKYFKNKIYKLIRVIVTEVSDSVARQVSLEVADITARQTADSVARQVSLEVADITARQTADSVARQVSLEVADIIARQTADSVARQVSLEVADITARQIFNKNDHTINEDLRKIMVILFEITKKNKALFCSLSTISPWDNYKSYQFGFWFSDFYAILKAKEPIPNIFCAGLNCVLGDKPLKFSPNGSDLDNIDILALWGQSSQRNHIHIFYQALLKQKKIVFVEDGFFYNVISYVKSLQGSYPEDLTQGMSFTLDDITAHFDGSLPSRLEQVINSEMIIADSQIDRSRILIEKITKNKITKYNYQSTAQKEYGTRKHKILIVDQAYGDYAVHKSGASIDVFRRMLNDAINENSDCDILIKVHPDMIADANRNGAKNGGYFCEMVLEHPNIILIKDEINPYVLIEQVDSVYVCTSQLGFEALMSEKKVFCYGVPFYAGWGLTIDRGNQEYLARRTKKRTLQEVFWLAYIWYSRYYSPRMQQECKIEDVLDEIIEKMLIINKV